MQRALASAIGFPRSATSARSMLGFLMPAEVRRSFIPRAYRRLGGAAVTTPGGQRLPLQTPVLEDGLAFDQGQLDARVANAVGTLAFDVAVEDDEVRKLADLDRAGRVVGVVRPRR